MVTPLPVENASFPLVYSPLFYTSANHSQHLFKDRRL